VDHAKLEDPCRLVLFEPAAHDLHAISLVSSIINVVSIMLQPCLSLKAGSWPYSTRYYSTASSKNENA